MATIMTISRIQKVLAKHFIKKNRVTTLFFYLYLLRNNIIQTKPIQIMKHLYTKLFFVMLMVTASYQSFSQANVYTVTSGELLFQWADVSFSDTYMAANPDEKQDANPLRFTAWFHFGQYLHVDFTPNVGLYTGLAFRNVGLISDETLNLPNSQTGEMESTDLKVIRRSYTLGLPLALKLGSFDNHLYFFGGGEIEMAYAYKEKYWKSHSRDGEKTKRPVEWFGDQTPLFIPSVFAGVQMPGGVNVKFKYYLQDFLNHDYTSSSKVSDLTRYQTSQIMYVSVSWQFNTGKAAKKITHSDDKMTAL